MFDWINKIPDFVRPVWYLFFFGWWAFFIIRGLQPANRNKDWGERLMWPTIFTIAGVGAADIILHMRTCDYPKDYDCVMPGHAPHNLLEAFGTAVAGTQVIALPVAALYLTYYFWKRRRAA